MLVQQLLIQGQRKPSEHEAANLLRILDLTQDSGYERLALMGLTARGRSSSVTDLNSGVIATSGVETIPAHFVSLVSHFPAAEARFAFKALSTGEDVLIGDSLTGLLMRWVGPTFECFVGKECQARSPASVVNLRGKA